MTTITINRALLEQIVERFETCDCEICTRTSIDDIRAALAAPAAAPEQAFVCSLGCTDECVARAHGVPSECPSLPRQPATAPDELGQLRKDAERKPMTDAQAYAIAGAVFPYSQHAKCLELIRDAEAFHGIKGTPATAPEKCGHCGRRTIDPPWPVRTAPTTDDRHALQAAGTHPAPCARYCEAKAFELEIRGRKADTVRAEQALLAQDITLQNMAERHAQELCAYSVTVDKLRAERKPMGHDDAVTCMLVFNLIAPPSKILALIRAVEAHHGIGDKP